MHFTLWQRHQLPSFHLSASNLEIKCALQVIIISTTPLALVSNDTYIVTYLSDRSSLHHTFTVNILSTSHCAYCSASTLSCTDSKSSPTTTVSSFWPHKGPHCQCQPIVLEGPMQKFCCLSRLLHAGCFKY